MRNLGTATWTPEAAFRLGAARVTVSVAGEAVRFGATLKLRHLVTDHALHSHALNYGHAGSSGQQQVTCFEGADDNDLWRIKAAHGQPDDAKRRTRSGRRVSRRSQASGRATTTTGGRSWRSADGDRDV